VTEDPPITFGQPAIEGNELEYIRQAVECGRIASGGQFTARCADVLRGSLGACEVLLTTSCTDALEMAALLLDLGPGDTVVVPSFTFVSSALAFARTGAGILFCDIERVTLGLDPAHLAELMDDSVRAVVVVHYAGVAADLDGIQRAMAPWPRAVMVEDNAHGLFGAYRGLPLGGFGRFSTLSFHETKNFVCGEGGALVLNDRDDVDRAHVLLDKGTNRRAFFDRSVDKYTWIDTGSSFGMADVLAAYLYAQLEQRRSILASRRRVFDWYAAMLRPFARSHGLRLPAVPDDRDPAYHMFYVLLPDRECRDRALGCLAAKGITAAFHYVPLHSSPGGSSVTARPTSCPVSEEVSGRLLRLPFHNRLTQAEIERVVLALLAAVGGERASTPIAYV
jgi:dTDP-4-amino-4,6-dideoxygalactose transaminase